MNGYRLATVRTSDGPRAAIVIGDTVYDAAALTGNPLYASVQDILDDWDRAHSTLEVASSNPGAAGMPVAEAEFLAPIPRPTALYCAGANYRDHAEEMAKLTGRPPADPRAGGAEPWFFLKSPHSVAAPDSTVHVSAAGERIDWEAELVLVIGRRARNVPVEKALDCVAGYTGGNDLSARDHAFRAGQPEGSPFRADWTRHKSFDQACPMGPWIVPAPYLPDPSDLPIRLWVNDELRQDSSSAQMIFSAAEQIAALSASITLHPGDMIMTGTPAGVGMARGEFLKPGDVVRMEIGGVGTIRNSIG